jgi:hypothetical protein
LQEIRKKAEQLAKMDKTRVVLSSRDAQDVGRAREQVKVREQSPPPTVSTFTVYLT